MDHFLKFFERKKRSNKKHGSFQRLISHDVHHPPCCFNLHLVDATELVSGIGGAVAMAGPLGLPVATALRGSGLQTKVAKVAVFQAHLVLEGLVVLVGSVGCLCWLVLLVACVGWFCWLLVMVGSVGCL